MDPYIELFKLVLPEEIVEYFDLVSIHYSTDMGGRQVAHLHLDEMDMEEDERGDLIPNGFYNEQIIQDFPIRDKKVILHVRRRRWKTPDGKTVSRDWDLKAQGDPHVEGLRRSLKKNIWTHTRLRPALLRSTITSMEISSSERIRNI